MHTDGFDPQQAVMSTGATRVKQHPVQNNLDDGHGILVKAHRQTLSERGSNGH